MRRRPDIVKKFGDFTAVKALLAVEAGETFGSGPTAPGNRR
jgi:hypothetical protein